MKRIKSVLCGGIAAGLAFALVPVQAQRVDRIVAPSGNYFIGQTSYAWVDEAREEVHTSDEGDPRELLVEVWYPAEPESDAQLAPYFNEPLADLYAQIVDVEPELIRGIRSNAVIDAPLASDQPAYPVIIFDPGFNAAPRQYQIIIEDLASHGYIVFAISRPYLTTLTVFPDGRQIEPLNADQMSTLWAPRDVNEAEFTDVWVPDSQFVLNQITQLSESDPVFAGHLDLDRLGMVGHSQGARTVSEVCMIESACDAVVNLDGVHSGMVEVAMDKPFMFISADYGVDQFVAPFEQGMEALSQDYYVLMIPDTQHMSFEDAAFWLPFAFPETEMPDEILVAQQVIIDYRTYITAFFDKHVKGEAVPFLDGPSDDFPEVFFLNRTEPITPPTIGIDPVAAVLGSQQGDFEAGSADVWSYEGHAGEILSLSVNANTPAGNASQEQRIQYGLLDTFVILRAPDGTALAANDDAGLGSDSAIPALELPADGVYRIEVRSWENQTGGAYTLILESE
jgi:hypothetical protein